MKALTLSKSFSFLLAFGILLISSCTETQQAPPPEPEPDISAVVADLWDKAIPLWENQDPTLISDVYADNFVRRSPNGTFTSAEEFSAELAAITAAYPDMKLRSVRTDIADNRAIIIWSVDGTFTGVMGEIVGNGKEFKDITGITVFTIEDGKVTEDISYWDNLELFTQLGFEVQPVEEVSTE